MKTAMPLFPKKPKIPLYLEPDREYIFAAYEPPSYSHPAMGHIYKVNSHLIDKLIIYAKEPNIEKRINLLDSCGYTKLGRYILTYITTQGIILNSKHPYTIWEIEKWN